MQDLSGIQLKFRTHRIAFTSDIEKAFLQTELNDKDRDATRLLWLKDINLLTVQTVQKLTDFAAFCLEQRPHSFY